MLNALEIQKSRENESDMDREKIEPSTPKLHSTIIDEREHGTTALHLACARQKSSAVQILVNAGADTQLTEAFNDFHPAILVQKHWILLV